MKPHHSECFSLTRTLHATLQNIDRGIDLDDLHFALGLSFLIAAPEEHCSVAHWSSFARDAFFVDAARDLGLVVRPVHPPEAASGLSEAGEFAQHFDASYRPIIMRALEHHQPVIAWRGWQDEIAPAWGIITSPGPQGIGLIGTSFASRKALPAGHVALMHPPVQLYVVESTDAPILAEADWRSNALNRTVQAVHGKLNAKLNVAIGFSALDAWSSRIQQEPRMEIPPERTVAAHRELANNIAAGHESGLDFLKRHRARVLSASRGSMDLAIAGAGGVVAAMKTVLAHSEVHDFAQYALEAIDDARRGISQIVNAFSSGT